MQTKLPVDLYPSAGECGATDDLDCDGNNVTAFNVVPGTRESGTNRCSLITSIYPCLPLHLRGVDGSKGDLT